jgi:hypothetical protein
LTIEAPTTGIENVRKRENTAFYRATRRMLPRQAVMESQKDCADPAKHALPQEENEPIAPVGAPHNINSDPPEPFVLYSSSRWRISITHRYACCRRILFVAPIISETIQDIALQVVLYLSSIPAIITAKIADAMLGLEYHSAGEVLSGPRALHEWLLL